MNSPTETTLSRKWSDLSMGLTKLRNKQTSLSQRSFVTALVAATAFFALNQQSAFAQTVSRVSPVVSSGGSYTVSSSPLRSGKRVSSVSTSSGGSSTFYVSEAMHDRQTGHSTTPVSNVRNAGWSSAPNWQSEVVTTMYQMPAGQAPQLQSPPTRPATSTNQSNEYYSNARRVAQNTSLPSGAASPSGSALPSESALTSDSAIGSGVTSGGVTSSTTLPPTTALYQGTQYQNGVPAATQPPTLQNGNGITTAVPSNLNWQNSNVTSAPSNVVTVPGGYAYTGQGVCTPVNAYYVNNACTNYPSRTAYRPVVPRAPNSSAYLGQGLIGQPKAYVDGQPVRNFFRYFLP